jgi:hypothetical protein
MRLFMVAFIFLLLLTLGNAWLMHRERLFAHARDYAPLKIGQRLVHEVEWDGFALRELGAVVITMLVFGCIAVYVKEQPELL